MPTDNPKISLYVPQQIYTHFKAFQEERKLSMSQAGTVILATYFGIEFSGSTIEETTKKTTIKGIGLAEFTQLQQRVTELEVLLKTTTNNKTTNEPPKSTFQVDHQVDHQVDLTLAENQQKVKQTQEFGSSQASRLNRGVPMTRKRGTPHFEQLRREAIQKLWDNK